MLQFVTAHISHFTRGRGEVARLSYTHFFLVRFHYSFLGVRIIVLHRLFVIHAIMVHVSASETS